MKIEPFSIDRPWDDLIESNLGLELFKPNKRERINEIVLNTKSESSTLILPLNDLRIERVSSSYTELIFRSFDIYVEAFPEAERRAIPRQIRLLDTELAYSLDVVSLEGQAIAIFYSWMLEGFTFIEYFAIKKEFRGLGIWTALINQFKDKYLIGDLDIVLEVEEPKGEVAKKRIKFYERNWFKLSESSYLQPSYKDSEKLTRVRLRLMSIKEKLEGDSFNRIKTQILKRVYR